MSALRVSAPLFEGREKAQPGEGQPVVINQVQNDVVGGKVSGVLVHPQHWPEDLKTAGKVVIIIGSGSTAGGAQEQTSASESFTNVPFCS